MKTRGWILFFAALLIVSAAAAWRIGASGSKETLAGIYQDGKLVKTVDLAAVAEPYTIELTGVGTTLVRVEPGTIYIQSSSCPDQLCVKHGPLSGSLPVVCLPNKAELRWLTQTDKGYDAISGAPGQR